MIKHLNNCLIFLRIFKLLNFLDVDLEEEMASDSDVDNIADDDENDDDDCERVINGPNLVG